MSSPKVILPTIYAHESRPEWGRAIVAEHFWDRTKYVFENAGERTFMNEPARLHVVDDLPTEEREALAKKLLVHVSPQRIAAAKRKKTAAAKKAKAAKAKAEDPEGT